MRSPFEAPGLKLADTWYQEANPWVFDPASFQIFLEINEPLLKRTGLITRLQDRLYVITPFFDDFASQHLSRGLLRTVLTKRKLIAGGDRYE